MTISLDLGINTETHKNGINSLLERLDGLIRFDGVLSGNVIWHEILYNLGLDLDQKILRAFDIKDLESKIYGIKSIKVCTNDFTNNACLLFEGDMVAKRDVSTRDAAEAFAKVYAKLNSLQEKYGVKIKATVTTDGINIESSKENLVHRIIIPKREIDEVIDITIPIENALDTAIKKIID